jgi:hypothetical protein
VGWAFRGRCPRLLKGSPAGIDIAIEFFRSLFSPACADVAPGFSPASAALKDGATLACRPKGTALHSRAGLKPGATAAGLSLQLLDTALAMILRFPFGERGFYGSGLSLGKT